MINKPMIKYPDGTFCIEPDALREFSQRGVAVPDIDHIMFNTGKKKIFKLDPKTKQPAVDKDGKKIVLKTVPTLATIIYWIDGAKTEVVNSMNDKLDLDANGKPTRIAKELGIIYAYTKRCMCGTYAYENGNLTLKHEGFGRILNEMIDKAYDCQEAEAKKAAKKAEAAKRQADLKAVADAKKAKNPSLAESVRELKDCVDLLKADLEAKNLPKKVAPKKAISKRPIAKTVVKKAKLNTPKKLTKTNTSKTAKKA